MPPRTALFGDAARSTRSVSSSRCSACAAVCMAGDNSSGRRIWQVASRLDTASWPVGIVLLYRWADRSVGRRDSHAGQHRRPRQRADADTARRGRGLATGARATQPTLTCSGCCCGSPRSSCAGHDERLPPAWRSCCQGDAVGNFSKDACCSISAYRNVLGVPTSVRDAGRGPRGACC